MTEKVKGEACGPLIAEGKQDILQTKPLLLRTKLATGKNCAIDKAAENRGGNQ